MDLRQKRCIPCEGGTPKLGPDEQSRLLPQVPGWKAERDKLLRRFDFKDFREAMGFVNRMAEVAESEQHHPDFSVHYNQVDVTLWTHKIGGLSENDFILAAKLSDVISPKG